MADTNAAAGPGVIVVAEERVHSLLANADIAWNVQERQQGVASMWQGLSSGALDQRSRILIFSDSLLVGTANDDRERRQTAQALVMMAKAGAVAGIVQWREEPSFLRTTAAGNCWSHFVGARDPSRHFPTSTPTLSTSRSSKKSTMQMTRASTTASRCRSRRRSLMLRFCLVRHHHSTMQVRTASMQKPRSTSRTSPRKCPAFLVLPP
ncbi:MAG: hypothetical protein EBY42_08965 [Actinobacteria bacterium]|nr:hypothetical protein [Actinomycetota bacterium]